MPVGTARVRIYREDDKKKWVFHGLLASDEASESLVAEMYGGGRWVAQLVGANETGKQTIQSTKMFSLPGRYRPPAGDLPGSVIPMPLATPLAAPTIGVDFRGGAHGNISPNEALNQVLVSQVLETVRASREVRGGLEPILAILAPALPALIEGLFGRKNSETEVLRMMVEEMRREFAALRSAPGPVTSGISDAIRAIKELAEARDMVRGESDDGEGRDSAILKTAMQVLAGLVERGRGDPGAAPVPESRIPGKTEVPMRPRPNPPLSTLPMWQQVLLHYKDKMLEAARRGVSGEFAAEMALNFMEPDIVGVVKEFVARPDMVEAAASVIPELREFAKFSADFWNTMREGMSEEEEPDGDLTVH